MRKLVLERGPDRPNDEQLMTLRRLWLEDMCEAYTSLEAMRCASHMRHDGVLVVPLDYRHAFINRGGYEI